jgi:hypothetical protein
MAIAWSRGTPDDDVSDEAAGSLAVSGALAGGTSDNSEAMTAPGSEPATPLASDPATGPHVEADRRSYRRIVRGPGGVSGRDVA